MYFICHYFFLDSHVHTIHGIIQLSKLRNSNYIMLYLMHLSLPLILVNSFSVYTSLIYNKFNINFI